MFRTSFSFATGIENTFIVDPHPLSGKTLEEYELSAHYERWYSDLRTIAATGIDSLRLGFPWYRIEAIPGTFDWTWTDQAVGLLVDTLHVDPIVDLVHYGSPRWLPQSFLDPTFPEVYLRYVSEFAARYRGRVRFATPINEPLTAAEFCGRKGEWPPYAHGDEGFDRIMVVLAVCANKASKILSDAGIRSVHVEVSGTSFAASSDLEQRVETRNLENELYWDLITARVRQGHPLRKRLIEHGVSVKDLTFLESEASVVDVMGVNYYPQWSDSLSYRSADEIRVRPLNTSPATWKPTFERLMRHFWDKYGLPLMVTETSIRGPAWEKNTWLKDSLSVLASLKESGMSVLGYTWFPAIDMVDWQYRNEAGPASDYIIDLGLWTADRKPRSSVDVYRGLITEYGEKFSGAAS